jgi:DNA-binding MarR family transcriptional regulator
MTRAPALSLDQFPSMGYAIDFLRLLWAVDHDLQQKSIAMQRDIGVTGPQRLVIRIVGHFPGISPGQLAGLLGAHPSTATGLTKRLVQRGLLRTRPDPRDSRRIQLTLTSRGRRIEVVSAGTIEEAVDTLLASSRPAEITAARAVLERLRTILGSTHAGRPPKRVPA